MRLRLSNVIAALALVGDVDLFAILQPDVWACSDSAGLPGSPCRNGDQAFGEIVWFRSGAAFPVSARAAVRLLRSGYKAVRDVFREWSDGLYDLRMVWARRTACRARSVSPHNSVNP